MERRRLVVFSGAGLSADSGLSTFRGASGTWNDHRIDQVCDIATWRQNIPIVHRFYSDLRMKCAAAEPNAMHRLLVDWQVRFGADLVTQNIDDLLERAGGEDVLHVHGKLTEMRCLACGTVIDHGLQPWDPAVDRCSCGSRKGVKPNVVFFGEEAPAYPRMLKLIEGLGWNDVLVVIGTEGAVVPIGSLAAALPCRKALNVLEPPAPDRWRPGMVAPALFHRCIFRPAAEAVDELDGIVTTWMTAGDEE